MSRVPIFAAGTYRGREYTVAHLNEIVKNFRRLGPDGLGLLRPPNVIGHEEQQQFLERTDLPSAGWPKRVWREGKTLFADFTRVPIPIAKAINSRAYRKVSAEIYDDFTDDNEKSYGLALRRIAILGGEVPQVKGLGDIPFARFESHSEIRPLSGQRLRGGTFLACCEWRPRTTFFRFSELGSHWEAFAAKWQAYRNPKDGRQGARSEGGRVSYNPEFVRKVLGQDGAKAKPTKTQASPVPSEGSTTPRHTTQDPQQARRSLMQSAQAARASEFKKADELRAKGSDALAQAVQAAAAKDYFEDEARLSALNLIESSRRGMDMQRAHEALLPDPDERKRARAYFHREAGSVQHALNVNENIIKFMAKPGDYDRRGRSIQLKPYNKGQVWDWLKSPSEVKRALENLNTRLGSLKADWVSPAWVQSQRDRITKLQGQLIKNRTKHRRNELRRGAGIPLTIPGLVKWWRGRGKVSGMRWRLKRANLLSERPRHRGTFVSYADLGRARAAILRQELAC